MESELDDSNNDNTYAPIEEANSTSESEFNIIEKTVAFEKVCLFYSFENQ